MIFEFTPKSPFATKSPKGDSKILLIFSVSPFEVNAKGIGSPCEKCPKRVWQYKETEISAGFREYFRFDKSTKRMELNNKTIEKAVTHLGTFVLAINREGMNKEAILTYYRKKDSIEKMFDITKNEMDGNRLRVHEQTTMGGRLFIKFLSLILYSEITQVLKEKKLFKKIL